MKTDASGCVEYLVVWRILVAEVPCIILLLLSTARSILFVEVVAEFGCWSLLTVSWDNELPAGTPSSLSPSPLSGRSSPSEEIALSQSISGVRDGRTY